MIAKATAIIVLLIVVLIVAIQNIQPGVPNFLFRQISVFSSPSVVVSFVIGLLTGCLLLIVRMKKKKDPRYSLFNVWQVLLAQYYERILMGKTTSLKGE
jgi:uncharacterized integral membrane protein